MGRKKKNKGKTKKNNLVVLMLFVSLVILFLILTLCLMFVKKDYYKMESRLENVKKTVIDDGSDFETIGWLRVQGTNLDMPIVQSKSQSDDYPVELGSFVWSLNSDEKFHNKIDIMGHNIFNLSSTPKITSKQFQRFEELMAFVYYDFAKDNKYIQLTLDGKEYIYKIFSVDFISEAQITSFSSEDDYDKSDLDDYTKVLKKNSLYKYDIDVNSDDNLISLITCTRFFGINENVEFFVNGRLLRDGEKISNYKINKSKNYNKVKNRLKGDDENEEDSL